MNNKQVNFPPNLYSKIQLFRLIQKTQLKFNHEGTDKVNRRQTLLIMWFLIKE